MVKCCGCCATPEFQHCNIRLKAARHCRVPAAMGSLLWDRGEFWICVSPLFPSGTWGTWGPRATGMASGVLVVVQTHSRTAGFAGLPKSV